MKQNIKTSISLFVAAVGFTAATPVISASEGPEITGREYKIMLRADKFFGEQLVRRVDKIANKNASGTYFGQLSYAIKSALGENVLIGDFDDAPEESRYVKFLDTDDCTLRSNGFVLRERGDYDPITGEYVDPEKRKFTLKYRSPERFLSAEKDMSLLPGLKKSKTKFEEDVTMVIATINWRDNYTMRFTNKNGRAINPSNNWRSVFSYSASARAIIDDDGIYAFPEGTELPVGTLSEAAVLFPGMRAGLALEGYHGTENETLNVVSNTEVFERVYEGISVCLDGTADDCKVEGDFALTIWYDMQESTYTMPVVAELSFDYKREDETSKSARNAKKVFEAMQTMRYVDVSSTTKTSWVYSSEDYCAK